MVCGMWCVVWCVFVCVCVCSVCVRVVVCVYVCVVCVCVCSVVCLCMCESGVCVVCGVCGVCVCVQVKLHQMFVLNCDHMQIQKGVEPMKKITAKNCLDLYHKHPYNINCLC